MGTKAGGKLPRKPLAGGGEAAAKNWSAGGMDGRELPSMEGERGEAPNCGGDMGS